MPCSATYAFNTARTLTAVPDAGSTFLGWGGACSGTGTCQVTMSNGKFVTAMFGKPASGFTVAYYHTDVIGSVRAITDDAGAVVTRNDYAPFGEDTAPLAGNPFRFAGKELDAETGLNYFAARYYRNTWGRFTTVDPLHVGIALADPQQWNRYAYGRNNPLAFGDPSGLAVTCAGGKCSGYEESVVVSATGRGVFAAGGNGTPGGRPGSNAGAGTFIERNGQCGWAHPDDPNELYFLMPCPEPYSEQIRDEAVPAATSGAPPARWRIHGPNRVSGSVSRPSLAEGP